MMTFEMTLSYQNYKTMLENDPWKSEERKERANNNQQEGAETWKRYEEVKTQYSARLRKIQRR